MNGKNDPKAAADIDVARVCELADISLSKEEAAVFQKQMSTIVSYVRKISELDVTGIEPTIHGQDVKNVFREDEITPSLPIEDVLRNAPEADKREFKMPRIVE